MTENCEETARRLDEPANRLFKEFHQRFPRPHYGDSRQKTPGDWRYAACYEWLEEVFGWAIGTVSKSENAIREVWDAVGDHQTTTDYRMQFSNFMDELSRNEVLPSNMSQRFTRLAA